MSLLVGFHGLLEIIKSGEKEYFISNFTMVIIGHGQYQEGHIFALECALVSALTGNQEKFVVLITHADLTSSTKIYNKLTSQARPTATVDSENFNRQKAHRKMSDLVKNY